VTILHRFRSWFRWIVQRQKLERSLDDDLREYVEHSTADKIRDGIAPEQARRAARMELGGVEQTRERVRAVLSPTAIDACVKDVKFAFRTMASNKTFTALAVLCLALGIGANATIFSFMDSILFRSLPIEDPRSLVVLAWRMPEPLRPGSRSPSPIRALRGIVTEDGGGVRSLVWPYPAFEMFRSESGVFASVLGQRGINGLLVDGGEGGLADGTYVTGEFFHTLGVRAIAGRTLTGEDDRAGAPPTIVLSAAFSRERFGSVDAAVGRTIRLDNVAFTVVGVTPPEFFGLDPARSPDFYIPVATGLLLQVVSAPGVNSKMYQDPYDYWISVAGRLRPGITRVQAETVLRQRFQQFLVSNVTSQELRVVPTLAVDQGVAGLDGLRRRYREPLYVLFAMVIVILAIACANIASLLMSRAAARRREIAVRLSVGAGRLAIVRQLMTESVILALIAGVVGVGVAFWGMRLLTLLLANGQEGFTLRAQLNWPVLAFTAGVSTLTGIVFGLAPAIHATRFQVFPALKGTRSTDRDPIAGRRYRPSLGQLLIVGQIALSLVLLVGAGLFASTVANLRSTELGFKRDGLLLATINTARAGYSDDALKAFYRDLRSRLDQIPGVDEVSLSWSVLAGGGTFVRPVSIPGTDIRATEINVQVMGESFFKTMQIPILAGRAITDQEVVARRPVAIVDRRFAETYFHTLDVAGRKINVEGEGELEIVGVSANARHDVVKGDSRPVVFYSYAWDRHALYQMVFELRTSGEPMTYADPLRQVIREMNPAVTVMPLRTQTQSIDRSINQEIVFARLSNAFAVLAVLITSVGLYGTVSYGMSRRTEEIGLRMALGASRASVLLLAFSQVVSIGVAGLVIGVPASLAASRFVERFLWGVEPGDPSTMAAAGATSLLAVCLAGYVPANRASRINPLAALRGE
jgi:macrolide transport system ATP-binding/permease protein